jgi:hypothetical protein
MSYVKEPNFFILGAPKCGTTSLADWLNSHPNIYMSPYKEPHYYSNDYNRDYYNDREKYLSLFENASNEHKIIGEASTGYLYSKLAIKNILKESNGKDLKFIVMLRAPHEMAYSLHGEMVALGEETEKNFEKAWYLENQRKISKKKYFFNRDIQTLFYPSICKVGEQMERLFKLIDRQKVKVIFLEDLKNNELNIYKEILNFLELKYDGKIDFKTLNSARTSKSKLLNVILLYIVRIKMKLGIKKNIGLGFFTWLKRKNLTKVKRQKLDVVFEKELKTYFKDDINLLEKLLDRNLSHWY